MNKGNKASLLSEEIIEQLNDKGYQKKTIRYELLYRYIKRNRTQRRTTRSRRCLSDFASCLNEELWKGCETGFNYGSIRSSERESANPNQWRMVGCVGGKR